MARFAALCLITFLIGWSGSSQAADAVWATDAGGATYTPREGYFEPEQRSEAYSGARMDPSLFEIPEESAQTSSCPECMSQHDERCHCQHCRCSGGKRFPLYARGEYLLWQFDGMNIPALVVRGEEDAGGFVNAVNVYGPANNLLDDERSGGRIQLGYMLDDYDRWAVEGDYFEFGEIDSRFADGGDGTFPIVGRPFIDATTGLNAVEDISFPGVRGTVTVDADSTFQSAGIRLRRRLQEVNMTLGVRWAALDEGLSITEDLEIIAPSPAPDIGTTFLVNDQFATSNTFVGGELGFTRQWQVGRWSLDLLSKLAIGNTQQRVAINGSTVNTPPGGPTEIGVGGLLTQTSNIGEYEQNELSVIPELGVTGGYMLTDRLKLTGGYTFLYWSRVVRPGDQIDLEVNPELFPFSSTPGDGLPARPQFAFRDTDFWAHGLNAGLEYRW